MEGLVSTTSLVSDYLEDSGYLQENVYVSNRGFRDGASAMRPWAEMYPTRDIEEPDYFEEYGGELDGE